MARKRHSKAGSLEDLKRTLWSMIRRVERLSDDNAPPERVLRCAHALAQLSGSFRTVIETADLEHRIQQLEHAAGRNGHHEFS